MYEKTLSTEEVYQKIREMILKQSFEKGQRIHQGQLSATLGVSRTPVIKALQRLVSDGLVDNVPNRGFYIHTLTLRELSELFMVRQALEIVAATHAVEHGTDEAFDRLEALFDEFRHTQTIDPKKYYLADQRFHTMLFDMCDNTMLHQLNNSQQILSRTFTTGLLRPPCQTLQEHLELIAQLRARNSAGAQETARNHTEITRRMLQETDRQMRILGLETPAMTANQTK